jgi:hypothetical protein
MVASLRLEPRLDQPPNGEIREYWQGRFYALTKAANTFAKKLRTGVACPYHQPPGRNRRLVSAFSNRRMSLEAGAKRSAARPPF